jgi:hypothetical protein
MDGYQETSILDAYDMVVNLPGITTSEQVA